MTWPLAIVTTRGALDLPGPGLFALDIPAGDDTVDELLVAARALLGAGGAGWVSANGGLLSNLPAWENLLLATQWHAPASLPALEARIRAWCARLGYDDVGAGHLLMRQPARLDEDEQRLVGWLRLFLSRPRLVLCEGRALPGGAAGQALRALLAEELPGSALLVIDDDVPPGFTTISFPVVEASTP